MKIVVSVARFAAMQAEKTIENKMRSWIYRQPVSGLWAFAKLNI